MMETITRHKEIRHITTKKLEQQVRILQEIARTYRRFGAWSILEDIQKLIADMELFISIRVRVV